jgi:uncharacterized protein (DUF302 family)
MKRTVPGPASYDEVMASVRDALAAEGFGVLTEIDVKATLKKKLDQDFRRYDILGACNPPLAHRALTNSIDVGVLLPCNVVLYENDDGSTTVSAVDPKLAIAEFGDDELKTIADEVHDRLARVLEALG